MTREEAEVCIQILSGKTGEPDIRPWGEQFIELTRVHRKGSPLEKAQRLHRLYRVQGPLPDTHELMVARFEEPLFAEMAKALKKSAGTLRSMLHREQPAFRGEAPFREPKEIPKLPPALASTWQEREGFYVYGGQLCLGEAPAAEEDQASASPDCQANLVRAALNGAWLVLSRPPITEENEESLEVAEWVAVHEDHVGSLTDLLLRAKPLGSVWVHGGTSAAVDVEVAEDRWFLRDFEAGEPKGRGFIVPLGGDGVCEWSGVFASESLCLIRVIVNETNSSVSSAMKPPGLLKKMRRLLGV